MGIPDLSNGRLGDKTKGVVGETTYPTKPIPASTIMDLISIEYTTSKQLLVYAYEDADQVLISKTINVDGAMTCKVQANINKDTDGLWDNLINGTEIVQFAAFVYDPTEQTERMIEPVIKRDKANDDLISLPLFDSADKGEWITFPNLTLVPGSYIRIKWYCDTQIGGLDPLEIPLIASITGGTE